MRRKIVGLVGVVICLVLLSGGVFAANKELRILTWKAYYNPEVIEDFEQTYDVDVVIDDYLSIDVMREKLYSNSENYDILITAEWVVPDLIRDGMLEKLDKSKLNNFNNIHPWFVDLPFDKGNQYTIPYFYTYLGLVYNKEKLSAKDVTLQSIFEPGPELQGRIAFYPNARVIIGLALKYIGKSVNSKDPKDLELVKILLSNLRKNALSNSWDLTRPVVDPGISLIQGKADLALFYANEKFVTEFLGMVGPLGFKMPEEGGIIATDNMMIVSNAKNKEMAYKFLDFMMNPENAAKQVTAIGLAIPIVGVEKLLDPELAKNLYLTTSILKKFEFLNPITPEELEVYMSLWKEIE
ncbi:hypothetical protein BBF96_09560 [Anoxybacter fermentans]|uniref:ABC transporter substrate-binding protein n=1 Tax=Anoxybacter fermentans TaxID=1323375 RepID=A0A3S9SZ40_9FIRM|nr:spermidine/putrescine ABC transporter substrate-binding protein [Anoxybacter fermentans]AZR73613.1 hypothetical protein BBF96_09560 [Anoxybacter fermentans]